MRIEIAGLFFIATIVAFGAPAPEGAPEVKKNVRYKAASEVDFEKLLIEGQLRRPEISIVTGDVGSAGDGLLKLREDFVDHMAADFGEAIE